MNFSFRGGAKPKRRRRRGGGGPIRVKVQGVSFTVRELAKFDKRINADMKKLTRQHGEKLLLRVKDKINNRTGRLSASVRLRSKRAGLVAQVSTQLYYAQYVEFGFGKKYAFLYPAQREQQKIFARAARRSVKKTLGIVNRRKPRTKKKAA